MDVCERLVDQMRDLSVGPSPFLFPASSPFPSPPGYAEPVDLGALEAELARVSLARLPCTVALAETPAGPLALRGAGLPAGSPADPWFVMGEELEVEGRRVGLGVPAHLNGGYLYLHVATSLLVYRLAPGLGERLLRGPQAGAADAALPVGPLEAVYFVSGGAVCWREASPAGTVFRAHDAEGGSGFLLRHPVYVGPSYVLERPPGKPAGLRWHDGRRGSLALPEGEVVCLTELHVAVRAGAEVHICYLDGRKRRAVAAGPCPTSQLLVTEDGLILVSGDGTRLLERQGRLREHTLLALPPGQRIGRLAVDGHRIYVNVHQGARHWLAPV